MKTIWVAEYCSRHFIFEAYGSTFDEAKRAMELLLVAHRREYNLSDGWVDQDDINVNERKLGVGYRDHDEVEIEEIDLLNYKGGNLVGFEYNGMWIINPYTDEGGQFAPVDPVYYGFEPIHLGGGCMGLNLGLGVENNGSYILITDQRTSGIPTLETAPEDILIGKYDAEDTCLGINSLADVIAYQDEQCKPS